MSGLRLIALSLLTLVVAGCASSSGQRDAHWPPESLPPRPQAPVPRDPMPGVPSPVQQPLPTPIIPEAKPVTSYPQAAEEISGQAVVSLLKQARTARSAGQYDQASSALERALRIEPRNYFVWSALAGVYFDQKQYDQAESVAQKSNSLARGNVYVELENWKTIAAARQAQGDGAGAIQAQARVEQIERDLSGG